MSNITKGDWLAWKENGVTRAFYSAVLVRIQDAKDLLGESAGIDPVQDNFYRGFIRAYNEMLEFDVDFTEDEDES